MMPSRRERGSRSTRSHVSRYSRHIHSCALGRFLILCRFLRHDDFMGALCYGPPRSWLCEAREARLLLILANALTVSGPAVPSDMETVGSNAILAIGHEAGDIDQARSRARDLELLAHIGAQFTMD